MKILFLVRWFPYPTNNGSKLRIFNLLRGLSKHHEVTLLSFADRPDVDTEAPEIQSLWSEVCLVPWKEFERNSVQAWLGFLSTKPRSLIGTFSPEMAQKITEKLDSQKYDLVIASQLDMAAYYPYFGNVPALFEEMELGLWHGNSSRMISWKKRVRQSLTWFKLRIYLSQLLKPFCAVTVVSEQERKLVARYFPSVKNILVVPNCMNPDDYKDTQIEPKPNRLVFTGSFRYHANYEAMLWFVSEVFPLVLKQVPETELVITGDHADLALPSDTNISLVGYVDDIKSLIASATVAIAPLWSGGGTRLKILEAMAIGTPVVATSKGAEGLESRSGEHIFIADDPIEFSNSVIKLLKDEKLRKDVATKAKLLIREKYDWEKTLPKFVRLVESDTIDG